MSVEVNWGATTLPTRRPFTLLMNHSELSSLKKLKRKLDNHFLCLGKDRKPVVNLSALSDFYILGRIIRWLWMENSLTDIET